MGMPPLQISFALVVFVLTPEGTVATIGGQELTEGYAAPLPRRGQGIAGVVRESVERLLPAGTITSRIRPLMPRLRRDGLVVLPLWATGRLPEGEHLAALVSRTPVRPFDALGRLADQLHDHTLVDEAHSEFRRALASDPVSHQLMSEGGRLRALAMDELDLIKNREDGIPPVFGLLPKQFTIEQLQLAVRQAARLLPEDIQKSSNFRRRLVELTELGVLERTYGTAPTDARGRPPQFYRFNPDRWIEWLQARRHDASPGMWRRLAADSVADFSPRSQSFAQRLDARPWLDFQARDEQPEDRLRKAEDRGPLEMGEGVEREGVERKGAEGKGVEGTRGDDRVERLEEMMRALLGEFADIKRSAAKPEPPTEDD